MNWKALIASLPVAAVIVAGGLVLRPTPAFPVNPSCGTFSCSAEFTPCISQSGCNNGCDDPDNCQCREYGTPVWYSSTCAPNESDTACFCPIGPGDSGGTGYGGASGNQGCGGLWQYCGNGCS